jgi:hypothetical protein
MSIATIALPPVTAAETAGRHVSGTAVRSKAMAPDEYGDAVSRTHTAKQDEACFAPTMTNVLETVPCRQT